MRFTAFPETWFNSGTKDIGDIAGSGGSGVSGGLASWVGAGGSGSIGGTRDIGDIGYLCFAAPTTRYTPCVCVHLHPHAQGREQVCVCFVASPLRYMAFECVCVNV
jgi:hypothetical protein